MAKGAQVTLLLVDDDDVDILAMKRAIDELRFSNPIVVAHDGQEALDCLRGENGREKLDPPYIILLDLNMPGMGGIEFLEILRSDPVLKSSVVFVQTTSNADHDKQLAYDLNVAGYVTKSSPAESFLKSLKMLNYYWNIVELPGE